jgi:hypothetical protein
LARSTAFIGTVGAVICAFGRDALAGAWPMPAGETQVIATFDTDAARTAFDPTGQVKPTPPQTRFAASLFAERGLTPDLTLEVALGADQTRSLFDHSSGVRPSIALRERVWSNAANVVSLSVGAAELPTGDAGGRSVRSAGEARLFWGRSFTWRGRHVFSDVQAAVRVGDDRWRETDLDATLGVDLNRRYSLYFQSFSGWTHWDHRPAAADSQWSASQVSLLRRFGAWHIQVGARATLAGRETLNERGVFTALWRRF